jgi:predicted 3-demethylubiquinone-9 3-methyltransferase (glyoxalase superfamily)
MQKITTFLTYKDQAEEAMKLYVSLFKDSKIVNTMIHGGKFFTGTFTLHDQEFMVLNGGPHFTFAQGTSLFVKCETQEEIDRLYDKLSEGGEKQPCGWLQDKFGVSWQIIPPSLGAYLQDKDPKKSQRVMEAMLKMKKIIIKDLQEAYDGK